MLLTVLGNCGPYPAAGAGTSGYLVRQAHTAVLLECGCGVVPQLLQQMPAEQLDAVVLTHLHWDHISDFMMLATTCQFLQMKNMWPEQKKIDVWMQEEPADLAALVRNAPGASCFRFQTIRTGKTVSVGALQLTFTPARHPIPCAGVRVYAEGTTLYYTGDTNVMPQLEDASRGADVILADCGLPQENWTMQAPHLSAVACGQLAKDSGAKMLLLGHLPPYVQPETLLAQARSVFDAAQLTQIAATYRIE